MNDLGFLVFCFIFFPPLQSYALSDLENFDMYYLFSQNKCGNEYILYSYHKDYAFVDKEISNN